MKDNKKQKEQLLGMFNQMIEQLQKLRNDLEFDKKMVPYFILFNLGDEKGNLKTMTLGNLDLMTQVGLVESYKVSALTQKRDV